MRNLLVMICMLFAVALGAASAAGGRDDGDGDDRKLNVVVLMTDDQTEESLRVMPRTRAGR